MSSNKTQEQDCILKLRNMDTLIIIETKLENTFLNFTLTVFKCLIA